MADRICGPMAGSYKVRDWYQEENLAALESLKIHYGPALIAELVEGLKPLPANSAERLSLTQKYFGRDGQQILMLLEATKTV